MSSGAVGASLPDPLTLIVMFGVVGSLLGMSKVSENAAALVGANLTIMVQEPAGATVFPEQLSAVIVKGATSGFTEAIVPRTRSAFPLLPTVTVCVEKRPFWTVPNGSAWSVVGETGSVTVTCGTFVDEPVPLTLNVIDAVDGSLLGM